MERVSGYFSYGRDHLTAGMALKLARGERIGALDAETRKKIRASQRMVSAVVAGQTPVYGINTGFGPLCNTRISPENSGLLQHKLLISHSVGVGAPIPDEIAKLMLVLKLHALSRGYSGIAEATLDRILWHIEEDIIPLVPAQGSVGASGDLAPLAHLFLPLIGLGQVRYKGKIRPAAQVLQTEGLEPIILEPKEGLALINGTQFIAAFAVKVVEKLHSCLTQADVIGALMTESLLGSCAPFKKELHRLRPFPGNLHVAQRIFQLLTGSAIGNSHIECERVQDPYSLRCIPQVHGASRTAWLHLKECLEVELNAVTDNPVIFSAEEIISGGNFHGQPLALPLDYACLAASELGSISDRRTYLSLTGFAEKVPKLLLSETGLNSGFMILQYTSAALASENKGLCFPASADSIPTSLGQEDHVSMGSIGGRKALKVCQNLERILAIELLCAGQAFDFQRPLQSTPPLEAVHHLLREQISHVDEDRVFAHDIEKAVHIIQSQQIIKLLNSPRNGYANFLQTDYDELFELY